MAEEAVIPTQFTHSIKLSDTAKGIRIDVHVYANDQQTALDEAFEMYITAKDMANAKDIPLAPIEVATK
jgi:hypothetical protein